jgi:hypothetical protein
VIPELPNEVSSAPDQNLVDDNSTVPLQDSAAQLGETTCTQLVPGKKYQVRQAPSGGYGIYEGRSTALVQWYAEEDDARDAIDQLKECELVTDAGICPVCSKPYLRLDEQWHAHVYVHKEHKEPGKRKPHLDSFCRTGAGDENCPTCGEKYANSWWVPSEHCHHYSHNDTTVDGDTMLVGDVCKGPVKGKVKKAPAPAKVTAWHSRVIKVREQAKAKRKAKYAKPDVDADDGEQDINNLPLHDLTEKDLEDMK